MSFYSVLQPWKTHKKETDRKKKTCKTVTLTQGLHFNRTIKLINFSLAEVMTASLRQTLQTQGTHTFPMYRLGQTSSTGVSSSVQESKMSSSSLMSARSCGWLLSDILPGHGVLLQTVPNTAPAVCVHCLFTARLCSSVRDVSRWLFECPMAPKLALSVQWVLSNWM